MSRSLSRCILFLFCLGSTAFAEPVEIDVRVKDIKRNGPIPAEYALCKATEDGKSTSGDNVRPTISWVGAPRLVKSFAVFMMDPDVPADFSKAGKEGMVVEKDAPRQDFFHWGIADISQMVVTLPGSKQNTKIDTGLPLKNDLGKYMADATQYGGPCPPWNDERLHHYHFIVLGLDEKTSGVKPGSTAKEAYNHIIKGGHVIAQGELVGTYTLNPKVK